MRRLLRTWTPLALTGVGALIGAGVGTLPYGPEGASAAALEVTPPPPPPPLQEMVLEAVPLDDAVPLDSLRDATWLPEARRCRRRPRYHCDGPRRARAPQGTAAERAGRLGLLDSRRAYDTVMSGPASKALLEAVPAREGEGLLWPVPEGFYGRGFGYVRRAALRSRLHRGIDIPAPTGTEVRATNAGLVVYADNGIRGYGNLVILLHADDTRTLYAHLKLADVAAGDQVRRGQRLGEVGRTGLTRAPHLHFEWLRRARPRNPRRHFVNRPSAAEEREMMRAAQERRAVREAERRERRLEREARERRRARTQARRAHRGTATQPARRPRPAMQPSPVGANAVPSRL